VNPRSESSIGWHASGRGGAVAAGGAEAVQAGIDLLAQGGNAADAAVATIMALSITDHGLFAIGGEVPFMIYDANRRQVEVLSGLGCAPQDAKAIEWYMANGIPTAGDIKAAPVPAALGLCITALMRYGTKSFADAAAPALALLDAGGRNWHERLAHTLRRMAGGRDWYERLARTLRRMAEAEHTARGSRQEKLQAANDRFYTGDIADELEAWYVAKGGFLRKADLAAHVTRVEKPVTVDYRGYTVCKCDTWTQGPVLCQALRLLEGFDLKAMGHLSADYVHALVESLKLAFADRDEYYGDPLLTDVPTTALLAGPYTDIRRELIDMAAASTDIRPGDPLTPAALKGPGLHRPGPGGTTTCVVADRWGNLVAATPSCNVFGNKGDGGATGVTHGNRLRSFNTCPGHPNCIAPGKRPRITLTPTLVLKDGRPAAAISVAGGDLQDQTSLNVLLNAIEFGFSAADAVTAPLFSTFHHENSFNPSPVRADTFVEVGSVCVHSGIEDAVQQDLKRRGHTITVTSGPIANPVMLLIDPDTGLLHAAGDPAAGRHAAAID